jgi:hypothetical protein
VERGDTGLGRDAYGPPRRPRPDDRRSYGPEDAAGPAGDAEPEGPGDDEYGHLLRRPGEAPPYRRMYQPGRPRMRPPGRFAPPTGYPADGLPPNGPPAGRGPVGGGPVNGGPVNRGPVNGGPMNGAPVNGGPASRGPMSGRQYRLPNGRRVPPGPDHLYRPQAPWAAGGTRGRGDYPGPAPTPGHEPPAGAWVRPPRPAQSPGGPPHGPGEGPQAYGGVPGAPGFDGAAGVGGASGFPGGPGFVQGPPGSRPDGRGPDGRGPDGRGPDGRGPDGRGADGRGGWGRLGAPGDQGVQGPRGIHGVPVTPESGGAVGPTGTAGPVIRQRESAVPGERPVGRAQPAISIAPDGLESFARDLRALRAKAGLDYPEMAEASHYTMKTLVSAAGGLRLPTLPVAVAYVRACGGNVAEWEERWQKLATKVTADSAKKRRGDAEGRQALPEPAGTPAIPEPPTQPAIPDPASGPGEIYVITSAKPRQPGW